MMKGVAKLIHAVHAVLAKLIVGHGGVCGLGALRRYALHTWRINVGEHGCEISRSRLYILPKPYLRKGS
ncbi:hypothetical protein VJ918_05490 [Adlercreutzia sp. R21]|uniref:hypothetical protein n=1 Tax=Adlercreutzia wanghongyangiae TaxID=3111451 RepID=UPI002DBC791F|nr:hypothetical protein [Adlercreutzia sp. R21]MEC4184259.1 hypothetical protein [Adlercreutzia sp. R21]